MFSIVIAQNNNSTFQFGNTTWNKRTSEKRAGPGNNIFGIHKQNISIDKNGCLVLQIRKKGDNYSCAEVYSTFFFKEGKYEIIVKTNAEHFTPEMVLGIFLFDSSSPPHFNEIDIEFSQWGRKENKNSQFAIHTNNKILVHRFLLPKEKIITKYIIDVSQQNITISSLLYNQNNKEYYVIDKNTFNRPDEFKFQSTRFHFNLWLTKPLKRKIRKSTKVTITSFKYTPYIYTE